VKNLCKPYRIVFFLVLYALFIFKSPLSLNKENRIASPYSSINPTNFSCTTSNDFLYSLPSENVLSSISYNFSFLFKKFLPFSKPLVSSIEQYFLNKIVQYISCSESFSISLKREIIIFPFHYFW
jgi:hypothetical protein